MFDQNKNPEIINRKAGKTPVVGIVETGTTDIVAVLQDGSYRVINPRGEIINRGRLFKDAEIISFVNYEDELWITTSDLYLHVLKNNLAIHQSYLLENMALSAAPTANRSGVIISYYNKDASESFFEHRSLPDFNLINRGSNGPKLPIISSASFFYDDALHLACCSRKELYLIKESNGELIQIYDYSDPSGEYELYFSQVLADAKKFLVDNMGARAKPDITLEDYVHKICFFRNDQAPHGAVDKKDEWIAFLNSNLLKMVNCETKQTYKFETKFKEPSLVKVLKYRVVCVSGSNLLIYDFRNQSLKFIQDE